MRKKFVFLIVAIMLLANFNACNRSKDSALTTPQIVKETATTQEVTTIIAQQAVAETIFEFANGTITGYTEGSTYRPVEAVELINPTASTGDVKSVFYNILNFYSFNSG